MNRVVGCLWFAVLTGALGCSGTDTSASTAGGSGGGAPAPEVKGAVFQGSATAVELTAMMGAATSTKATPMPSFTSPPPVSEYLAKEPPPTFQWRDKGDVPEGSNELTYLHFNVPGQTDLLHVLTSEKSFTPTEDEWKKVSVGTWVTVDIFGGAFDRGALKGDSVEGDPVQFCSMPPGQD